MVLRLPAGAAVPPPLPAKDPGARWAWPVDGRVTSVFGHRTDPIRGGSDFHTGLDISASTGTPVHVPAGGRVVFAGWNDGGGNMVIVDHGGWLQSAYAHLSAIDVPAGAQVNARAVIGKVGTTGYSTGPHLHFEVKKNGQAVDPRPYLV